MIGYTMVGTNNLERAIEFYDPLMARMSLDVCWRDDQSTSWGRKGNDRFPLFFVGYPFDGQPATIGNGVMTAFRLDDLPNNVELVGALHSMALKNGGCDEGAPGFRPQYSTTFYAAYVRDLDGNKLAFVCYDATK